MTAHHLATIRQMNTTAEATESMDLSTTYMGLELKNPFVPSSSPLTKRLDPARQLEDAGASALVICRWRRSIRDAAMNTWNRSVA